MECNENEKEERGGEMKISKLASAVFAVVGTVLLVGSIAASFVALSSPTKAVKPSKEANDFAQEVLNALDSGDFVEVAAYFYGEPAMGLDWEPATAEGRELWNAYRSSMGVTTDDGCYSEGTSIYQTAQVTCMDIGQTLSGLEQRAGALLTQKLDEQEDPTALLGEDGQIPQTLRDEIRMQALQEALAEPETMTAQITFQLIEQDGQWWVLPDQALLDVLSGGRN